MMMDWSEMLPEVLDIIAQKHITCYEEYPIFAGVCKSWRLAAARTYQNSNGPPSRLPSLLLAEKSDDHESRELFLLSNKSIRKIRLPEAYGMACKSSCGWLITVGKDLDSQLINPISREIINLPNLDTFRDGFGWAIDPLDWHIAIDKVVLVMESKLVIIVIWGGDSSKLGFCHIGDDKWTSVEQNNDISGITFYNGLVYTSGGNACIDKIQACNVNGKESGVMVDVATVPLKVFDPYVLHAYIVGKDDGERKQLLLIIRQGVFNEERTTSFQVLAYDLASGNWSKVKDFGTKTLFVGFSSSFWVEDTTGVIKCNCIYYTDDETWEYGQREKGGDMGIYHLSDGTIEPHYTGESRSHLTPPIWFQS